MLLTQKNFNSEVPYESWKEKPFRFGNFTTMGEFYIETGLSTIWHERLQAYSVFGFSFGYRTIQ